MEIRLDQITDEQFRWRESLSLTDEELGDPNLLELDEVDCRGTIDVTTSGFVLRLHLDYSQTVACVRCLEPIEQHTLTEHDLLITVGADEESDDEIELNREDLGVVNLHEPVLDTRPMVIEQIQLAVPMKPLCREDCAGLCSRCGANLNRERCSCRPPVDPRWAALAALKNQEN